MSHTKGQWVARDSAIGVVSDADDQSFGMMLAVACVEQYDMPDEWEYNAKRIVDCVNACDGMENPADEIAKLRSNVAMITSHLESCANELTSMIDAHNEQSIEDGSWKYDHQTPWEALHLIEKLKVK